jgi:hypothetical protein
VATYIKYFVAQPFLVKLCFGKRVGLISWKDVGVLVIRRVTWSRATKFDSQTNATRLGSSHQQKRVSHPPDQHWFLAS